MTCAGCAKRAKDRRKMEDFGSAPKCAFPNGGPFESNNWNCVTANMIRAVCADHPSNAGPAVDWRSWNAHRDNSDTHYATIEVPEFDEPFSAEHDYSGADPLALWVTWYKRRGQTDQIVLLFDNAAARAPTEAECLKIIERLRFFNRLGEMSEKELA